jgi:glycosyltransferase involved in cell wall biosynthesis
MGTPVYHITTAHDPFDRRIYHRECRSLTEAGYDVHVIVPSKEELHGQWATFHSYKPGSGRLGRFLNHNARILQVLDRLNRPGMVHFHDPDSLLLAPALKRRGHRVVFDVHEEYAKQMTTRHWVPTEMRPMMASAYEWLESKFSRYLDAIIAATPAIATHYDPRKTVLVQNFPRLPEQVGITREEYQARKSSVLFYGILNDVRGLDSILKAVAEVNKQGMELEFRLGGAFLPTSYRRTLEQTKGWRYTRWLGYLNQEQIREELRQARMGVLVYDPVPNHLQSQPNKLFDFMAYGLPLIYSDFPHWQELVGEAGIAVSPGSVEEIAAAMRRLLKEPIQAWDMGQKGQQRVRENYTWSREEERLLTCYRQLSNT